LRDRLPAGLVRRLRADSFTIGRTMNARQAGRALREAGLEILERRFLIHAPRFPAIRTLNWFERRGAEGAARLLESLLERLERLSRWPFGALSGHYTGWWLRKVG
jgi:hypothetical protein